MFDNLMLSKQALAPIYDSIVAYRINSEVFHTKAQQAWLPEQLEPSVIIAIHRHQYTMALIQNNEHTIVD